MLFIAQLIVSFLWLVVVTIFGVVFCVLRWGNPSNNRFFGIFFSRVAIRIIRMRLEIEGRENFESHQPCIYISNHQSMLEVVLLGSIYPRRTILIGKKELIWIPFFGIFYAAAGNLLIDRKKRTQAVGGLNSAVTQLKKKGTSIWIFPEGTRNRGKEEMLPFKKGAFHMAIGAQVPLLPVVCEPIRDRMDFGKLRFIPGKVRLKILPPISTDGMTSSDVEKLMGMARGQMIEAYRSLSAQGRST